MTSNDLGVIRLKVNVTWALNVKMVSVDFSIIKHFHVPIFGKFL
jgi:hypothetical protein